MQNNYFQTDVSDYSLALPKNGKMPKLVTDLRKMFPKLVTVVREVVKKEKFDPADRHLATERRNSYCTISSINHVMKPEVLKREQLYMLLKYAQMILIGLRLLLLSVLTKEINPWDDPNKPLERTLHFPFPRLPS